MMGKSRASRSAKELFAKNAGINALAAARVALFGARDVWFVVGVPVFLYSQGWTSPWSAASWRPGPSATAWCRHWRPTSSGAARTA
jgi:hypothetical protein